MRDGIAVIFIARPEDVEEFVQPLHTLGHFPHRLQPHRDAIIGKSDSYTG